MATAKYGNGIYICMHCGDYMGTDKKLCKNCDSADKRREMDKENEAIATSHGRTFRCPYCARLKK